MENVTTRAIKIAMNLFITIIIATAVFFVMNKVYEIYKQVYEVDTNINSNFNEYDMYMGTTMNYIDVMNTFKKYLKDDNVAISIKGATYKNETQKKSILNKIDSGEYVLQQRYTVDCIKENAIVKIIFK